MRRLRMCAAVLLASAGGCHRDAPGEIRLVLGTAPSEQVVFSPVSAFAEYLQLPGEHNELRITLAGYDLSCDRYIPPGAGVPFFAVTVETPPGIDPTPDTYAWGGHAAHGGTATRPEHAYAEPTARLGPKGFVFPPGGSITLTRVALDAHGAVEGILAFEFAGDADHPAMSARGRFTARICRSDMPPGS